MEHLYYLCTLFVVGCNSEMYDLILSSVCSQILSLGLKTQTSKLTIINSSLYIKALFYDFFLLLFALTPLASLHYFLIYVLSFSV